MQESEEWDIDPSLTAVIIWHESNGDPLAYSVAGAVGLMQVMPSDGLAADDVYLFGLCYADRPTIDELEDPQFNISFGVRFLADLIEQEDGSLRDALMRYGPSKVGYAYADSILSTYQEVAP